MTGPDPQILDLAFLRRQTAGDVALERDLLRLLIGQCDALLPLLVSDDDSAARRDAAHSLRGAASGLGAERLARMAGAIEAGAVPPVTIGQAMSELRVAVERHLATGEGERSAA